MYVERSIYFNAQCDSVAYNVINLGVLNLGVLNVLKCTPVLKCAHVLTCAHMCSNVPT